MDLTGTRLSHYQLTEKLGEGGMGAVYRAEDVRLGRQVALKLLPPVTADDLQARERFLDEARAVSALEHPNVCLLYEFGEADGQLFFAMQVVDGETLAARLHRGPMDVAEAERVLQAVCEALGAAHARGIVHRDVKCDNILLGHDGAIKLADFGLARLAESVGVTATSTIVGTLHYLSPEQIRGARATALSDQFALGVVAYQCVTNLLPFAGGNPGAVMYAIANTDPDPLTHRRPDLPQRWSDSIARALAKDPATRFASIADFSAALRGVAIGEGRSTAAVTAPVPRPAPTAGAPAAAASATPTGTTGRTPSLAVLYFENLSSNAESDYFCAGITEDILTDLSKVPGMRVASRNAVARFRGRTVDPREVARTLGVSNVLEGSVRLAATRVRINAQLVHGADGFQVWADRYDRTLEDVFAVQEEIAHSIAVALRGALSPAEAAELGRGRPAEIEAYDLYLRGRDHYRRYTFTDMKLALECFESAVRVDARYALAWAGIADCCAQILDKAWDSDPQWEQRGFDAAHRSILLDPQLAEGHKAEALLWRTRRDHERAVQALRRALDANPRFLPGLINLGQEFFSEGDFASAELQFRRTTEVDPAYGFGHLMLASVLLYTRRYEEAVAALHRAQSTGESPFYATYAYAMRAHSLVELGDRAAAEREVAGGRAAGVAAPILDAAEALIAAHGGERERAARLLAAVERETPAESYGCELAAAAAARLGDAPLMARLLRAAEKIDKRHWAYWRVSPDFRAVRDSVEFAACIGDRGRRMCWPIEAPPLPPEDRAQFTEFVEASGLPAGSAAGR